jgi:HK97 family phage prohead protease
MDFQRELAGKELTRFEPAQFDAQEDERTVEFSFSSETPVKRWFGNEVLSHDLNAVDLGRMNDGAPVLFNHDPDRVIGVVERAWVDGEKRRARALVRFSRNSFAEEVLADVRDGVLRNISVGYSIDTAEERDDNIVVTRWQPHEVSVVSIPADPSIGIGRSLPVEAAAPAATTPVPSPTDMEDNTPNLEEVRALAVEAERSRVASITSLCREHNVDLTQSLIERGASKEDAKAQILEEIGKRAKQPATPAAPKAQPVGTVSADIGLTDKETRSYSFVRAIRAQAFPNDRSA